MKATNKDDLMNLLLHTMDDFMEGHQEFAKIEIHFDRTKTIFIKTEVNNSFSLAEVDKMKEKK